MFPLKNLARKELIPAPNRLTFCSNGMKKQSNFSSGYRGVTFEREIPETSWETVGGGGSVSDMGDFDTNHVYILPNSVQN